MLLLLPFSSAFGHSLSAETGVGALALHTEETFTPAIHVVRGLWLEVYNYDNDSTSWIYRDFPVYKVHSPSLSPEMTRLESTQGNSLLPGDSRNTLKNVLNLEFPQIPG